MTPERKRTQGQRGIGKVLHGAARETPKARARDASGRKSKARKVAHVMCKGRVKITRGGRVKITRGGRVEITRGGRERYTHMMQVKKNNAQKARENNAQRARTRTLAKEVKEKKGE